MYFRTSAPIEPISCRSLRRQTKAIAGNAFSNCTKPFATNKKTPQLSLGSFLRYKLKIIYACEALPAAAIRFSAEPATNQPIWPWL